MIVMWLSVLLVFVLNDLMILFIGMLMMRLRLSEMMISIRNG